MEKLKSDDLKSHLWQSVRVQSEVCEMYQRVEIRACLLTLKLIENVFEHFESLIDEGEKI